MKYLISTSIALVILLFVSKSYAAWLPPDQYMHLLTPTERANYYGYASRVVTIRDGENQLIRVLLPKQPTANVPAVMSRGAMQNGALVLERRALGSLAGRAVPVIGIALTAYMMKDDIRALIEGEPESWPALTNVFTSPGDYPLLDENSLLNHHYTAFASSYTPLAITNTGSCSTWEPWCANIPPAQCIASTNGRCKSATISYLTGTYTKAWKTYSLQDAPLPTPRMARDDEIIADTTYNEGGSSEQVTEELDRLMEQNPDKVKTDTPVAQPLQEHEQQVIEDTDTEQQRARDAAISQLTDRCAADGPGSQACIDLEKQKAEKAKEDIERRTRLLEQEKEQQKEDEMPQDDTAELKGFDFSKLKNLRDVLTGKWPFTLLLTLGSQFSTLASDPVAPEFDFHVYQDNQVHVSLAMFDPLASLMRWIWKLALVAGCIWITVTWWRGVASS